jgi:hypothetical protein
MLEKTDTALEQRITRGVHLVVHQTRLRRRHAIDRLVRLDIWGHTLLGERVASEMAAAYLILSAVFVFEVSAWTLLFNYVFHKASFVVDRWTLVALGLGLLWGSGIFVIDKGLITTDLRQPGYSKWWGFGARMVLIGASALLTAQPIEQLVFNPLIEERLKDELLRVEAVAQVEQLKAAKEEFAVQAGQLPEERIPDAVMLTLDVAKKTRSAAREELGLAQSDVKQKQKDLRAAEARRDRFLSELNQLKRNPMAQERVAAVQQWYERQVAQVRVARTDLARAQDREARAKVKSETAQLEYEAELGAYNHARNEAKEAIATGAEQSRTRAMDMERFVDALRRANYGDLVTTPSGEVLQWRRADLIERSMVLDQLKNGKPPRWPAVDAQRKKEAIELMGLPVSDTDAPDAGRSIFWPWLSLLLIASAIPSLAIFFKFTMSEEMKNYYSVECQRRAGNPEAVLQQRVQFSPNSQDKAARELSPG